MSTIVKKIKLGSQGLEVSAQGLGCLRMSTSFAYGAPKPEADMISIIRSAVDSGITHLDTSDVYGPETNELLVGKALKDGYRERVELATKFGVVIENGKMVVRGDPIHVRAACEASLKRLQVDCIDLYYQHRIDTKIPIEITMGELKKLVEEGKIKYVGLSEACASTIRRAHAVHLLSAVQLEWSLWEREAEAEIIPTCRELGIGIVAYCPLGGGFLSSGSKVLETIAQDDVRKLLPKFSSENERIYERISEMARKKHCTTSQLSLAWLHHQGDDVCPIPGSTKMVNLQDNAGALAVTLTSNEMAELESLVSLVKGERYHDNSITSANSETPPLSAWKGH